MTMVASALGYHPVPPLGSGRMGEWVTLPQYAHIVKRPVRRVYVWLYSGLLHDCHIPLYQDERGKWWIKVVW